MVYLFQKLSILLHFLKFDFILGNWHLLLSSLYWHILKIQAFVSIVLPVCMSSGSNNNIQFWFRYLAFLIYWSFKIRVIIFSLIFVYALTGVRTKIYMLSFLNSDFDGDSKFEIKAIWHFRLNPD